MYLCDMAERENYEMDMLWSQTVGKHQEKPTYINLRRWHEHNKPLPQKPTGKDIMDELLNTW